MPSAPQLVPTQAANAVVADVTYHIQGELVPVLTIELDQMPVYLSTIFCSGKIRIWTFI
jgi:hypothetical protein